MKVKIEFKVELKDVENYTYKQLEDFLRYEFRDNMSLNGDNPFMEQSDCEPIFGTFNVTEI